MQGQTSQVTANTYWFESTDLVACLINNLGQVIHVIYIMDNSVKGLSTVLWWSNIRARQLYGVQHDI